VCPDQGLGRLTGDFHIGRVPIEQHDREAAVQEQTKLLRERVGVPDPGCIKDGAQPLLEPRLVQICGFECGMAGHHDEFSRRPQEPTALPVRTSRGGGEVGEDCPNLLRGVAVRCIEPLFECVEIWLVPPFEIRLDEFVLALEMIIERTLGDPGLGRDRIDADRTDALLVEKRRSRLDDLRSGGGHWSRACILTSEYTVPPRGPKINGMNQSPILAVAVEEKVIELQCRDGVVLRGHLWQSEAYDGAGTVIVNAATGVRARYYHRFARYLAEHGFRVLTYDYRGIGASRPRSLRGCGYRWRDWGEQDFDAALRFALAQADAGSIQVVGHSIGGFLPGFSPEGRNITRMLTVGAQYAYWRDYSELHRTKLFWKWHVAMPALTLAFGYFPGKRLDWLEDLPAGVANEWSFRGRRMERSYPASERGDILSRFGSINAKILAVGVSDDPIASLQAIDRALEYYSSAPKTRVLITPFDLGMKEVGHFGLFHEHHRHGFWQQSLQWLCHGRNPWPFAEMPLVKAQGFRGEILWTRRKVN